MRRESVERADLCEHAQLVLVQTAARFHVIERAIRAPREQVLKASGGHTPCDAKSEADRSIGLDDAAPLGAHETDRTDAHSMSRGIFDERGGRVEAHRLVVEQTGKKFRRTMHLQPGAA
jgi:hypothetical protein